MRSPITSGRRGEAEVDLLKIPFEFWKVLVSVYREKHSLKPKPATTSAIKLYRNLRGALNPRSLVRSCITGINPGGLTIHNHQDTEGYSKESGSDLKDKRVSHPTVIYHRKRWTAKLRVLRSDGRRSTPYCEAICLQWWVGCDHGKNVLGRKKEE